MFFLSCCLVGLHPSLTLNIWKEKEKLDPRVKLILLLLLLLHPPERVTLQRLIYIFIPLLSLLPIIFAYTIRSQCVCIAIDSALTTRSRSMLFASSLLILLLILSSILFTSFASIHIYDHEPFQEIGNAYLLSGGSEGIAASLATASNVHSIHDGRSYIRYSLSASFPLINNLM